MSKKESGKTAKSLRYKVVETSTVTDERLEEILNSTAVEGWQFDTIQFVRTDASKRPAMAFVLFTRDEDEDAD